ncbi:MAG: urease accessory protein [Gammaproteobacteria bacterium]|nr:urease accessory protein [Gammaproteobacteria bacterium]
MISLLFIGFLIGMRHALEADHIAAIATLATRTNSLRGALRQGAAWGLGHTATLFLFGSVVILMDSVIPETFALKLEFAVGCLLVILGLDVMRKLIRDRIHFHTHKHTCGVQHFHAHSHSGQRNHSPATHQHQHPEGFPIRALLIGLIHGMAGSTALILLTLETIQSPLLGLTYIALFGLGSMLGMAVLSVIIAIPLRRSAQGLTWLHNSLQAIVGIITIALGSQLVMNIGTQVIVF